MFSYFKIVIASLAVFMYFAVCQASSSAQSTDQIWVTKAYSATGLAPNNGPAVAMATRGNRVAIGYPLIATVVLFEKDEFGQWKQIDTLVNPDGLTNCYFGQSLCFVGDDLFVGSYSLSSSVSADRSYVVRPSGVNPTSLVKNSRTYVYRLSTNNKYSLVQKIEGVSVNLATNGVYFVAGPAIETLNPPDFLCIYIKDDFGQWVLQTKFTWYGDFITSNIAFVGDYLVVVRSGHAEHAFDKGLGQLERRVYTLLSKGMGLINHRWPFEGMNWFGVEGDSSSSANDAGLFVFGKVGLSGWILLRNDSFARNSPFGGGGATIGFASLIRSIANEVYASDPLGGGDSTVAGSGAIHFAQITSPNDGIPLASAFTPPDRMSFNQPVDETRLVGSGTTTTWHYSKYAHPENNPAMSFGYSFDLNDTYLVAGAPKRGYFNFGVAPSNPYGAVYVYDRISREFKLWVNGYDLSNDSGTTRFGSSVIRHGDSFIIGSNSASGTFHTLAEVYPLTVTLAQPSLTPGVQTSATIKITRPAPKGGIKCLITPTFNNLTNLPSTVVIPEGKLTASFPVLTNQNVDGIAIVTVVANGFADCRTLFRIVSPRVILNVSAAKTTLGPGETTDLSVTIDKPAPSGGITLSITKSVDILAGPSVIIIPQGAVTGTVTLTAKSIPTATTASVSITTGSDTKAVGITVNPPTIKGFSISPTSVPGGQSATGTLNLSYNAPDGGITVKITSNNGAATVPATVTVPAGVSSTTFPITTKPVTTLTVTNLTAMLNGVTVLATLSIRPPAALSTIVITPANVVGGTVNATGTITLSDVAPAGGGPVTLASNKPTAATVPATVVVPEGSTSTTFTITSKVVTVSTPVTVTGKYLTVTKTATVTVDPPGRSVPLASLQSKPSTTIGGETVHLTLTLRNPAPPEGVSVVVQVSDAKLATAPSTVFIPAGASQSTFAVLTQQVFKSQGIRVTVRSGKGAVSSDITLTPQPKITKFMIAAKEVLSNQAVIATVELASPAPSNGTWVSIKSTNKSIEPVQDFLVPSGTKSTSVTIRAGKVTRKTVVNLTAATSGGSKTLSISVLP